MNALTIFNAVCKTIALQTRRGIDIDNGQSLSFSPMEINMFNAWEHDYPERDGIEYRTPPSSLYNCHGLTFASRRTMIDSPSEVAKILEHDDYDIINVDSVKPGDIAIYHLDNGEIDHSAVVISRPCEHLHIPRVVSKWGKFRELIHPANKCPYNTSHIVYYRIKR